MNTECPNDKSRAKIDDLISHHDSAVSTDEKQKLIRGLVAVQGKFFNFLVPHRVPFSNLAPDKVAFFEFQGNFLKNSPW